MSKYLYAARVALLLFTGWLAVDAYQACTQTAEAQEPRARVSEPPAVLAVGTPEPAAVLAVGTPEPAAVTLAQGQQVRVLTLEQWQAIQHVAPERQEALARIAWCESRWDAQAVGDGGHSRGAWQVQERFWGPVPATLAEQAKQAERIAAEHGLAPWTTAGGCEGWR